MYVYMYPGDAKLSDSLPALIQELTLCCQAAMAVSILIALKTNIEVNYNLADKKFEMMLQLGSGKAANAPKIIKTSNAPLDFSNFPLSDNTTDNKNTSSSSSSSSSSTRASRSSAEVKPPLTGVGSESSESEVIPVLLLRQYHFFNGLMNDPTGLLVLKEHIKKKKKPTRGSKNKENAGEKKKSAKGAAGKRKRKKKQEEWDVEDEESGDEVRMYIYIDIAIFPLSIYQQSYVILYCMVYIYVLCVTGDAE